MSQRTISYLILIGVVLLIALYIVWPQSPGIHVGGIQKDFTTRLGLDLVGGVQALMEADIPAGTSVDADAMSAAASIIENRVNGLGLTEALVQQAGSNRIVIELPGETDPEKALSTIRKTGMLELVDFSNLSEAEVVALSGQTIQTSMGGGEGITVTTPITQVFQTVMTGADLRSVNATADPNTGKYIVNFSLSPDGTKTFADYTSSHIGTPLAIVVDKRVISTPVINSAITGGQGMIEGNFTAEEANNLAVQLRYGSLPIALKVIEVRTVGPTLGQESLNKSLLAGAIGFVIVMLFMALFYRVPGIIADIAILIYAMVAFAIFRFVPVTLTLPGIAGFMLSTGSALDANILIFERMKEEMRAGKPLKQAMTLGFQRAWPSIRDSNLATLITCGILFWFGSTYGATIVKGFSITLFLGVLVSLFTSLVVTRTLMEVLVNNFKSKDYEKWFGI